MVSVDLPRFQELDVRKPFLGHLQVDPVGGEVDVVDVYKRQLHDCRISR